MLARKKVAGFTLVEMAITLVIMGILASLAYPSFTGYLNNLAVRNTGESLLVAAQTARSEAIRSNNTAVLQIVDTLDDSCSVDTAGRFWVVSHCSAAGKCGQNIDKQSAPPVNGCVEGAPAIILAKGAFDSSDKVLVNLPAGMMCYSSMGRVNATAMNCPAGAFDPRVLAGGVLSVDVEHDTGSCVAGGGVVRCLRLNINMGGEPRLCDPAVSAVNDPRRC